LATDSTPRTVARSLRGAFAIPLVCLLLAGLAGTAALAVSVRGFEQYVRREAALLMTNDALLQALTDAETAERGYLITGRADFLEPYEPAKARFEELVAHAADLSDTEELADLYASQGLAGRGWFDEFGDPVVTLRHTDADAALALASTGAGRTRFESFREISFRTEQVLLEQRDRQLRTARTTALAAALLFGGLIVVAVLGGLRIAFRATAAVTGPLRILEDALNRLRTGDYTTRIEMTGPRELRVVGSAVNELAAAAQELRDTQAAQVELGRQINLVSGSLHKALEVEAILRLTVKSLGPHLGDRAVARRLGPDGSQLDAQWCADGVSELMEPTDSSYPAGLRRLLVQAATDRRSLLIHDTGSDERLDAGSRQFLATNEIRSFLAGAVRLGPQNYFVVAIHATSPRSWNDVEVALFDGVLREVGTATTNAVAFDDQRLVVERLERLDRDKTDFMSTISHELRTPLTSIMGYLELLNDGDAGELNEDQHDLVATIDRNSKRLLGLIEDLLVLSRIEGGTFTMVAEPVDIANVARHVAASLMPLFRARPVELIVNIPATTGTVLGDEGQLERVLLNLLTNAAKFTPPNGTVAFTLSCTGDVAEFVVSDTGIGVPLEEQDRLFERFFRSSTARDRAIQGTGLGLAISKTIVERHGGDILVESEPDIGTTFRVRIPLMDIPATSIKAVT